MATIQIKTPEPTTQTSVPKIGELCTHLLNSNNTESVLEIRISKTMSTIPIHCRIVGDGLFTDSTGASDLGKEIDLSTSAAANNFYVKGSEFYLFIGNKYNIVDYTIIANSDYKAGFPYPSFDYSKITTFRPRVFGIDAESIPLSQFKSNNIVNISGFSGNVDNYGAVIGNIEDVAKTSNSIIELSAKDPFELYGDISEFANSTNLTTFSVRNSTALGDVANLYKLKNLTMLRLESDYIFGEATKLLDDMFADGRTSGSLALHLEKTRCTYNGLAYATFRTITFSDDGWTSS